MSISCVVPSNGTILTNEICSFCLKSYIISDRSEILCSGRHNSGVSQTRYGYTPRPLELQLYKSTVLPVAAVSFFLHILSRLSHDPILLLPIPYIPFR